MMPTPIDSEATTDAVKAIRESLDFDLAQVPLAISLGDAPTEPGGNTFHWHMETTRLLKTLQSSLTNGSLVVQSLTHDCDLPGRGMQAIFYECIQLRRWRYIEWEQKDGDIVVSKVVCGA